MKDRRLFFYIAFLVLTAAVLTTTSFTGSNNIDNASLQSGTALTENDFVKDPSLFAVPEAGVVATFLENPNSTFELNDTGPIGIDIIPFKYASGMNQTFCWQDDNRESRHSMTLVDSSGAEVLRVEANGDCVTQFINEGNYEMRIQHDDSGDEVFATIFSIPEGLSDDSFQTVLNTNKCQGCDLSGANFSNGILTNVNLSGADLTGADLSNADLSGANLSDALLAGTDLTGANLTNADLSGADLTNALTANANFTDANLTNVISFNESKLGEESITAQEEPGDPGPDPCPAGNLRPKPVVGEDLVLSKACMVPAGTYQYGNINIISGGSLTFNDAKIDFWAKSILVENGGSLIAGTPEKPIGTNGEITIHLYGADRGKGGKGITCKTDDMCGVPKAVWDRNHPPNPTKCTADDLPGGVNDCFYRYGTLPVDTGDPKGYFGYKVIAVSYGGTLQLFGKKGATYPDTNPDPSNSGTSWVRLADGHDLTPGGNTLVLDRAVDWQKEDRMVVTTTDYLPGHSERLTVDTVSADGKTITVKEKIQFRHNGTMYDLSSIPGRLGLDFKKAETRAAVALLSRSIRIVSGPNSDTIDQGKLNCVYDCFPSTDGFIGGHTIARQGFKTFQVEGVEFFQLGQGGRMGHYPLHFHLARKTPLGTFVKDSSIHDSMTRWITVHGTHDVLLARNVGYMSIGHGFYLEDGTEINNKLYSNIGIFARAAIANDQNPRKVPGILAGGAKNIAQPPNNSDFANPTVFWIMNGWNDFEHNMAVGAATCGTCYWLLPSLNSGPSQNMAWESYASIQRSLPGASPLKTFKGNYCTSAQLSFNTVGATDACNGLGDLSPIDNPTVPPQDQMPRIGSLRIPTLCTGTCSNNKGQPCNTDAQCGTGNTCTQDCTQTPPCGVPSPGAPFDNRDFCPVTILDRYTSSFHWPEKNFAAIWLRGKWFLLGNSVLTDSQNGGLGFVTGGDYTLSSVIPGNWQVARKSVFIGNTQEDNPLASNAGPFNPLKSSDGKISGLTCDNKTMREDHCLSKNEGITMPVSNFSMQQRFFNIYDGPNYQDSNAYLDITTTPLDPQCKPGSCPRDSGWMYTAANGIPIDQESGKCVLPNAAIGWKQPNGFFYPPAFHSLNLFFNNVDIRHLVIEPLWKPGTFDPDTDQIKKNYCTFDSGIYTGFTSIDRQTVLNDDDGSLTGLKSPPIPTEGETISVNLDPFFNAPVEAPECESFDIATASGTPKTTGGTAKTSPYEYLSTVVYPKCGMSCGSTWGSDCSNPSCFGVTLSRQLEIQKGEQDRTIPMMGMNFGQRSMLTVDNGSYYVDTTVSENRQKQGRGGPTPVTSLNVFKPGETYYVFFVFATEKTKQKYQLYIGAGIPDFESNVSKHIKPVRVDIRNQALKFEDSSWNGLKSSYESSSGILTVGTDFSEFKSDFDKTRADYCQPSSFCKLVGNTCQSSLPTNDPFHAESQHICSTWAGKDIDCPLYQFSGPKGELPGCVGFALTLDSQKFSADDKDHRPGPECFPRNSDWNVAWTAVDKNLAGSCANQKPPDVQFCDRQSPPIVGENVIIGTEGDDVLTGTPESDIIFGLGGNDIIEGRGGSDWISGGPGDDEIRGGRGDDIIFGEEGNDFIRGGGGRDEIDGGSETDTIKGGKGKDICVEGEIVRGCEQ